MVKTFFRFNAFFFSNGLRWKNTAAHRLQFSPNSKFWASREQKIIIQNPGHVLETKMWNHIRWKKNRALRVNCFFSPPVRWGLLGFMSTTSPLPPRPRPRPSPSPPRPRPSLATKCVQCGAPDLNCDHVSSGWRAGPQLRSCECSVACRTSTAILWVQCGVPDLNRDPVSSVWRAGPQPRFCEFSVACRTSTAILWVQCCVPDLNRDPTSSVCRAGPQPRNVSERMSEDTPERKSKDMSERMSKDLSEDMSERMANFFFGQCCARCNNSGSHGVMLK